MSTPVSNPELVDPFQKHLLRFVHGKDMEWPVYGNAMEIFNITSQGFVETKLPEKLRARCEKINAALLDPANGA